MPRSDKSPAGKIVDFFRSAELGVATLVLGLCKDEVGARVQKSESAKERARKPAPAAVTRPQAVPHPPKRKVKKAKAKARVAKPRLKPATELPENEAAAMAASGGK